jgi:hypothetical protein
LTEPTADVRAIGRNWSKCPEADFRKIESLIVKLLPEQLLHKPASGGFGKAIRLAVRQDDYASLGIWC